MPDSRSWRCEPPPAAASVPAGCEWLGPVWEWRGRWDSLSATLSEPPVAVSAAARRNLPVIRVHFVPGHIVSGLVASKLRYSWPTLWGHWDM